MTRLRHARLHDLPGAYRVCALTAGAGDGLPEGAVRWADPDLVGHVYVGPYIACAQADPSLGQVPAAAAPGAMAVVIVDHRGVSGYCLAAVDTAVFSRWCHRHWWPGLREDYPADGEYPEAERELVDLIHAPAQPPAAVLAEFPSHLHIDLLDRARGSGMGRRLIETVITGLRAAGSPGVHLEVGSANTNAIGFYRHLGFRRAHSGADAEIMTLPLRS